MKKKILVVNVILLLALIISDICYINYGTIQLKTITSMWFVLMGLVNLWYAVKENVALWKFFLVMMAALVFCLLGDVGLYFDFIVGAAMFATGHVLYFVAYCIRDRFHKGDFVPSFVIMLPAVCFLVFAPIFNYGSVLMEGVCVAYAVIISFMVGKAVGNMLRNRNATNVLFAVGSALFFFSDLMLVLNMFGGAPRLMDILCLSTYYPAQGIIAYGMYQNVIDSKKE